MLGEIGIPVLLLIFGYVFYIFTRPQEKKQTNLPVKGININVMNTGTNIPGMYSNKSKKRKK